MKKLTLAFCLSISLFLGQRCQKVDNNEPKSDGTVKTDSSQLSTNSGENKPGEGGEKPKGELSSISFDKDNHDFGKIKEGEKVTHVFKFKNSGEKPLTVSNVKPSCGCTASNWTKDPVLPGQEGTIEVTFDSKGKPGNISKSVDVFANTDPEVHQLKFKGEVEPEKK